MSHSWSVFMLYRYEKQRLIPGVGTPAPSRRGAHSRRIFDGGSSRLPRCRSSQCAALVGDFSPTRRRWLDGRFRPWSAAQTFSHTGKDRATLAGRQPNRTRIRHRIVDRASDRAIDRGRMGHPNPPVVRVPVVALPRVVLTKTATHTTRARSRSDCRLASHRVAPHQKKARRRQATLVLIDESGLLMAPLVRRTWAPRGQTPVLRQRGKHRERVSVAAALWVSPHHLGLVFRTLVNDYFNNHRSAAFLEVLMREIPGRLIVIWD